MQKAILREHPDLPKYIPNLIEQIQEHRRSVLPIESPRARWGMLKAFFLLTAGTGCLLRERNAQKMMNFVKNGEFKLDGLNNSYFLFR